MAIRTIETIIDAHRQLEGGGFPVQRPFPTYGLDHIDPFLLLDRMGPIDWPPGEAIGAPDHPHRGFETVTYVLEGEVEHRDSKGHQGRLGPGDVQWMTAGSGVVHSEMPPAHFKQNGGRMHGFQVWVNLPARDKMMAPRYQEIPASEIPVVDEDGVRVRIVAGESMGQGAVIETRTPIMYLHFTVQPGASLVQTVPTDYNAFAFVFGGAGAFGREADPQPAHEGQVVAFVHDGDEVWFSNPAANKEPLELLLLGGVPLREPVARYGPFVMNTKAEIMQAFEDYRNGTFLGGDY